MTFDGANVKFVLLGSGPKDGRLTLWIAHPYLRQTAGSTAGIRHVRANMVDTRASRLRRRADQKSQKWESSQDESLSFHPGYLYLPPDNTASLFGSTPPSALFPTVPADDDVQEDTPMPDLWSATDRPLPLRLVEPHSTHRLRVPMETLLHASHGKKSRALAGYPGCVGQRFLLLTVQDAHYPLRQSRHSHRCLGETTWPDLFH